MLHMLNKIIHGDCFAVMPTFPNQSFDMILSDLPYGKTVCSWDSIFPLDKLWSQYSRLIKPNGSIVLTALQPFASALVMSKLDWFKYSWIWVKNRPTGGHHSKNRPMSKHEDILVFSPAPMGHVSQLGARRMTYNPQGVSVIGQKTVKAKGFHGRHVGPRPNQVGTVYQAMTGFPNTVLEFSKEEDHLHPTQKPVALFEYLIRTYTDEGAVVLDNAIGVGTTAIAAVRSKRNFVGIEMEKDYIDIANERLGL